MVDAVAHATPAAMTSTPWIPVELTAVDRRRDSDIGTVNRATGWPRRPATSCVDVRRSPRSGREPAARTRLRRVESSLAEAALGSAPPPTIPAGRVGILPAVVAVYRALIARPGSRRGLRMSRWDALAS